MLLEGAEWCWYELIDEDGGRRLLQDCRDLISGLPLADEALGFVSDLVEDGAGEPLGSLAFGHNEFEIRPKLSIKAADQLDKAPVGSRRYGWIKVGRTINDFHESRLGERVGDELLVSLDPAHHFV